MSKSNQGTTACCISTPLPHLSKHNPGLKSFLLLTAMLCSQLLMHAQLNISTGGQTGTAGTNWTTSGTNPVTINITGSANVNTSVIQNYLNAGVSVIVYNNTVGTTINNNIAKTTGAAASLSFRDIGNIRVVSGLSITSTSNAMDIVLWADVDNSQAGTVMDFIFVNPGTTFSSNGGKIVMAGGPDNGTNGGVSNDGIPDGFAWNGSSSTDFGANDVGGLTLGPRGGTGTVISLNSGGGDIILRGSTSNSNTYPGITSQGNLKIESGAGKIIMFGQSSTGHGLEFTYGAVPTIAISSSSSAIPAIDLKGTTSTGNNGFWAANAASGNILIQSSSALNGGINIEGTSSTGIGLNLGTTNTSIYTQVLSQAGTISLRGLGAGNQSILTNGDVYIGNRKDATTVQDITPVVTASAANILIQANDQVSYSNVAGKSTRFNTTGSLTMQAYTTNFAGTIRWNGNPAFASTFSSITLGEASKTYHVAINNTLTTTGNITTNGGDFTFENGVGLASTAAGTIAINAKGSIITNGSTRRTISTVNGQINLFADSDASGDGTLDADYLTLNAGTGETRVRTEVFSWTTTNNTDKPYINGTGPFVIEPSDAAFQLINTNWFVFDQDANGIAGLTIGKATNTGDITHETTALNVAGPISFYGGLVNLTTTLTSSADGDIFIKANTNRNAGASITATSSILKTAGTGTLTMQGAGRVNSGTITASGSGRLSVVLWSDYINANNGGVTVNPITTNGGHIWVGGSNTNGGSYTWNGLTVGNGPSVGSVNNNYNAIDFYGPLNTGGGSVLIWAGSGYSTGISGIAIQATGAGINTGTGDIILMADAVETNTVNIITTGRLTLVPDAGAYPANITWGGAVGGGIFNATDKYDYLNIFNFANLAGLNIGYYDGLLNAGVPVPMGNTSGLTTTAATSIAGSINLYSPALTINNNLTSTGAGSISLFTNALTIASGANLTSTGLLVIEPIAAATTIGIAGGTGTLGVPASLLTTNFSDGFGEIRIGNAAAGAITVGSSFTMRDNIRLITSGALQLNDNVELGNNHLRFLGTQINVATGKFVKTNGIGKLYQLVTNGTTKLFPVGTTVSNPVTLTNNTGLTDTFNVSASPGIYYQGGTSGSAVTWSGKANVTWSVGNTFGNTNAGQVDMIFTWDPATQVTGTFTAPRLAYFQPTEWLYAPNVPVINLPAGKITYSGYSGVLSTFAVVQANITLPVRWLSFNAQKVQNTVVLKWRTGAEPDNAYFIVERAVNGRFEAIGKVSSTQTISALNDYSFTDLQPLQGNTQYRIKQVDLDGSASYSSIVTIQDQSLQTFTISTRSVSKQLVVETPASVSADTRLIIYDGNGRALVKQQLQAGQNYVYTGSFANGMYYATVVSGTRTLFSDQVLVY